jgi:hypothetical protein
LRSLGDQPGAPTPRYLSSWRTLPEGTFIPLFKFNNRTLQPTQVPNPPNPITDEYYLVEGFRRTNNIPFPSEDVVRYPSVTDFVPLPYIAFNYLGQLMDGSEIAQRDEIIPLARGSASFGKDAQKNPRKSVPSFQENPPGNSTNSAYTLVVIDKLTGRPHVKRQEVQ